MNRNTHNNRKGAAIPVFITVALLLLVAFAGVIAWKMYDGSAPLSAGGAPVPVPANLETQCAQNPAYTYSAIDSFNAGTTVGGTDQIKSGTDAPVSSLAAPNAGVGLQYWKSNTTYFCKPDSRNAQCGSNTLQIKCIQNGTVTLSTYDTDNRVTLTNGGGANNLTVGANEVHNLELNFQAVAKKAVMPFGGCVAVEYPSTLSGVTLEGAGISTAATCPYQWTYTPSSTSNTYKLLAVPDGFDAKGDGTKKVASLQVSSGSTNPSGTAVVTFQPANYYVGNDGQIYLGIEKDKNQDNTKTMAGGAATSFVIA